MGLLQKRQDMGISKPLYTIGGGATFLLIGLGNPGKEYTGTRHNIGFEVLDHFAADNGFPTWIEKKDLKCLYSSHTLGNNRVIIIKPQTFMNLSGEAAGAVQRFYRIYNQQTVAVYDELAIPFGQIRTRTGGDSAGHNGVKSLIEHIDEDFGRVRIGIANTISEKADAAEFVLGKFTKDEKPQLPAIISESATILTEFIFSGQLPSETRSALV